MRIESISSQPDRALRYKVLFDDGSLMRLYRQTVQDFGLFAGAELDEEQMGALQIAASKMSAKMRAVRIVSAASVSEKDLQQRLIQKGEDPEHAKQAVAWMAEMNLVDDRQTACQIVERCASKGYGIARAKQALYEKRIPKQYWDEALQDYPDQAAKIEQYLIAHLTGECDEKQLKRAVDALLRRGHSYAQIRAALSRVMQDLTEDT